MKIEFRSVCLLDKQADQHNNLGFLRKDIGKIRSPHEPYWVMMISAIAFFIAYFVPLYLQNHPDLDALSGAFAIIGASMLWLDTNSTDRSLFGFLRPEIETTSRSGWWGWLLSAIFLISQILVFVMIFFATIRLMFDYIPNTGSSPSNLVITFSRTLVMALLLAATLYVLQRVKSRVSRQYKRLTSLFRREISKIEQSSTHSLWKAASLVASMRAGIRSLGLLFLVGSGLIVIVEHVLDILLSRSDLINLAVLWLRSFNAYKDGSV